MGKIAAYATCRLGLLAFFGSLFQSHQAMHLKILALQHQVAVYQQSVHRGDSGQSIACSGRGFRWRGRTGKMPYSSSNRVR
jgi:hypothetical protein